VQYTYPHTIDNGNGERITFTGVIPGEKGPRLIGENIVDPGVGPPMHVHHMQDEVFTVVEGRLGYQRLGEAERFADVGETVVFAAGEPHRFWNAGADLLRCTGYCEPADNVEYLLTEIFASAKRNGCGRPALFDVAYLARRYRSEYTMLMIPPLVQRVLFPVIVLFGTLMGRYERYRHAPAAVTR
jgi:uncharacterized cupin superfamily protein